MILHEQKINYDAVKQHALKMEPVIVSYPLSSIKIGPMGTMKINDKNARISDDARNKFLKNVLKVDPNFALRFQQNTNEKVEREMLNTLQAGMSRRGNEMVQIVANPVTKNIVNFSTGVSNATTHSFMFNIFEHIMNKYNNLELKDCYINDTGEVNLNVRSTKDFNVFQGEDFRGGLSISNSAENGSNVSHNALRLICTNGMTGFSSLNLSLAFDQNKINKFFNKLDNFDAQSWVSSDLIKGIEEKRTVVASVNEVLNAQKLILEFSSLQEQDINSFLPISNVSQYLARKGVDMFELNSAQRKNCPTNLNLWDLINQITYFGSHDFGFKADFKNLQDGAGKMFLRPADSSNMIVFN